MYWKEGSERSFRVQALSSLISRTSLKCNRAYYKGRPHIDNRHLGLMSEPGIKLTCFIYIDDMAYLARKLNFKSLIKQIKFVWNEWIEGWKSLKSCSGWKQGCKNLFKFSFILWILRWLGQKMIIIATQLWFQCCWHFLRLFSVLWICQRTNHCENSVSTEW